MWSPARAHNIGNAQRFNRKRGRSADQQPWDHWGPTNHTSRSYNIAREGTHAKGEGEGAGADKSKNIGAGLHAPVCPSCSSSTRHARRCGDGSKCAQHLPQLGLGLVQPFAPS